MAAAVNRSFRRVFLCVKQIGQPFVYNAVYGDAAGLSDTFHEFGHYCDFYLNGVYGAVTPEKDYDLAEVASTGLEMLIYEYYDDMLEGDTEDERLERLYKSLMSIIDGCMYDEAQQRVFAYEGELTVDTVNGIFRDVAKEYGMDDGYDMGFFWVEIPHTFESPFYYLSYAASAAAAMEIWHTGQTEGQDAAIDRYLNILSMGSFEYGYAEALEICGMRGFREEAFIEELALVVLAEAKALTGVEEQAAA